MIRALTPNQIKLLRSGQSGPIPLAVGDDALRHFSETELLLLLRLLERRGDLLYLSALGARFLADIEAE